MTPADRAAIIECIAHKQFQYSSSQTHLTICEDGNKEWVKICRAANERGIIETRRLIELVRAMEVKE